jgi:hypothetical protein
LKLEEEEEIYSKERKKMIINLATWSLILILLSVNTNGAREIPDEINVLKLHSMDHHTSSSHMDHMDPSLMVFFQLNDLKLGKTIPIYFPNTNPSTTNSPHLLPREKADSIPFSLSELNYLLQFFSFSPKSAQARAMENTLRQCEIDPIEGETKFCATSLESMLDFTRKIFGSDSHIKVITTTHIKKSNVVLQNYTIVQLREIPAPQMVACHTMPYPYAVFYCHSQESESKVFKVRLDGENGYDKVEALAVCHMDTSRWSSKHVSFRVLGIEPGSSNVCHFFPADNLVSVPTSTRVNSE